MPTAGMPSMPGSLISDHIAFDRLLPRLRRIAVLGIKPESRADRPAHIVPAYLHRVGYEVLPVPVYYQDVSEILGRRVHRSVAAIRGRVEVVVVFRKPEDLMPHVDDLIAARPRLVWLQTGIRNDEFATRLLAAGI